MSKLHQKSQSSKALSYVEVTTVYMYKTLQTILA